MDLLISSTGKIFYKVEPTLAAILIEALPSVFERVVPAPPAPLVWRYFVGNNTTGQFVIQRERGSATEMIMSDSADEIKKLWPDCPASVIATWFSTPEQARAKPWGVG